VGFHATERSEAIIERSRASVERSGSIAARSSLAMLCLALAGCSPLPEVAYETERLRIAPEFDAPICEGTLAALDEQLREVEGGLGQIGRDEPYLLYWMQDGLDDVCGEGKGGCFFPATRMMFAHGGSITHEMTHAALDSEGESYFLEEGMAELLSGVGVYYDVDEHGVSPAEQLRLSRTAYRSGHFDYSAAAHFMRWVYDARGLSGVRRLAAEVEVGAAPEELEETLVQVMGKPVEDVEADYRLLAPRIYEGLGYGRAPGVPFEELDEDDTLPGPEALVLEVAARLDCAEEDTLGPLVDEREGMYQVRKIDVPENAGAVLRVEGDVGTWVEVMNPYAQARYGLMTDWMRPDAEIDEGALRLHAGDVVQRDGLAPGVRAVILGTDGTASRRVTLHVELTPPEPPETTLDRDVEPPEGG
jgi:hypothetical protein